MSHDLPVPGHQRLSLAELPRPRRHRILVILRRHAPVVREPQPATRHLGPAAAGTFRPFQQAIRTARPVRPLPTAIQSVTSTGLRSSRARAPSGERGGVAGDDGRRGGGPGATAARACSAWAGACPARMRYGTRLATSIQAAPRTGCAQSISQTFWSWLMSRLLALMSPCSSVSPSAAVSQPVSSLAKRVRLRRAQASRPAGGSAASSAPAVDQPGQFAGGGRRGGDGTGGQDGGEPGGHGDDTAGIG